ncbi:hypothetical protein ACJJTC_010237 [Scirpophaga incertulas]
MKLSVVFLVIVQLHFLRGMLVIPKDNSHYVEDISRYIWIPRDDGELVLVDLHEPVGNSWGKTNGALNQYWLYTRNNRNDYQLLIHGDISSVKNSNYRKDKPLYVITHGWTSNGTSPSNGLQKNAFLDNEDCNVIVLDYRQVASNSYVQANIQAPDVGAALGQFLIWLLQETGGNFNNVHMTGYSLGAHVIASAGRAVGGRAARITGLDPAGPLWQLNPNRLTHECAQYVEVIHTDGGLQGMLTPYAHADFYPNGGTSMQPGCSDSNCSHYRSVQLFAGSVTNKHFIGKQCSNFVQAVSRLCRGSEFIMGTADVNKRGRGLYGLETTYS